jgi:hypothetical protein
MMSDLRDGVWYPQPDSEDIPDDSGRLQAGVRESTLDLLNMAGWARSLAGHLREYWPVQGQGQPPAGAPTNISICNLHRHLIHLKTLLFRFHPPACPPDEGPWLGGRMLALMPNMADTVGRIELVCDQIIDQFEIRPTYWAIDGRARSMVIPTINTTRAWCPRDGRPMPEIDPQVLSTLDWAAAKLFQVVGGEPRPARQEQAPVREIRLDLAARNSGGQDVVHHEEWVPASVAVERAEEANHPIALSRLSKLAKQGKIRTRPRTLAGKHRLEVEWNSLSGYLLGQGSSGRFGGGNRDREPSEGEFDEVIAKASRAKQRALD